MVHVVVDIDEVQEFVQFHVHFLLDHYEKIYFHVLIMMVVVVVIQLILLLLLYLNLIEVFQDHLVFQ
jgi:hypothetical protein